MPRAAAARKPAAPTPAPRPRKKAKPRARAVKKTPLLTPTEKQKTWLGGVLLGVFLLVLALCSGELVRTDDGMSVHFHDLKGAMVLNVEFSLHHLPRVAFR